MTKASEGTSKPALLGAGAPDELDRENIVRLISVYESKFPYPHAWSIGKSIESALAETTREKGSVEEGRTHRAVSMPEPFLRLLKKGYPLIISDKTQFEWFKANFPAFDLTNEYNDRHDDYKHLGKLA